MLLHRVDRRCTRTRAGGSDTYSYSNNHRYCHTFYFDPQPNPVNCNEHEYINPYSNSYAYTNYYKHSYIDQHIYALADQFANVDSFTHSFVDT